MADTDAHRWEDAMSEMQPPEEPPERAPVPTGPPLAAAAQERGPVGNTRSIGLCILWAILTLGIYTYIWVFRTQEEIKRYSSGGVGGWLGLVIYIVFSPITWFLVPSEVRYLYEDLDGGPPKSAPVRGIWGLWLLLPIVGAFVWFIRVQGSLNRYWESKGAPA